MGALMYENFLRKAFGNDIERGGDPAGLAEADIYNLSHNNENLNKMKIGTGYAMNIYNRNYMDLKELRDPDDYEKMNQFIDEVLVATTGKEIVEIIEKYIEFQEELEQLNDR